MPQDCVDHIRLAHAVPATEKAANLGRWFPPWTVSRDKWCEALNSSVSGVSMDALLFSQSCVPLVHRYQVIVCSDVSLRGNYMVHGAGGSRGPVVTQPGPGAVVVISDGSCVSPVFVVDQEIAVISINSSDTDPDSSDEGCCLTLRVNQCHQYRPVSLVMW